MAVVLREGGTDPLVVGSWQDQVKLQLLQHVYDVGGNRLVGDICFLFDEEIAQVATRWGYRPHGGDYQKALEELIEVGWVEASEYKEVYGAKQKQKQKQKPTEIFKQAVRLRLTILGFTKIPESVIP